MKQYIKPVIAGLLLLANITANAQLGSTPASGTNPYAPARQRGNSGTNPAPQNGNNNLGIAYQDSQCGLDYTTSTQKLSMRVPLINQPSVAQPATFPIAGIPGSATILKAYVWSDASGSGIPFNITVTNPASVTAVYPATLVGSDQDKCWGYAGTHTYRTDITAAISGNGNYVLSGLPTNPPTSGEDTDGATMMVIWSDNTQAFQGDIIIWDGALVVNGGVANKQITGFNNACANSLSARAFMCVADLQQLGANLIVNSSPQFTINEDWWNYIDQPTTVTLGQNSATYEVSSSGDCFNMCMMGLYYRTSCSTCCLAPLNLNSSSTVSSCSANNGTATTTSSNGTGPFTYSWNTNPVQTTQTATNLGPGQYIVTVTDAGGCSSTDTVNVLGQGNLGIAPTSTNVTCNGGNNGFAQATPTGGTGPFTYSWTPNVSNGSSANNLTAGTYSVTITDNFGCTATQTFNITEPPLVPLSVTASTGTSICTGTSVTLTASGSGGAGNYTYTWLNGVGTGTSVTVTPSTSTTYTVVISDPCNTPSDTDTVMITVNPTPTLAFTADQVSGCTPLCVNFTETTTPQSSVCFWDFDDNTTSTTCNPNHCFTLPGQYDIKLIVTDINGCANTLTMANYITVYPYPGPGFTAETNVNLEDPNVTFTDNTSGADTCIWDFGDGNVVTVPNCGDITHTYADSGTYHVMQIVVNQWGCRDTIWGDVIISPFSTIYIPNTFTPNGNGTNDIFYVYGEYLEEFEMLIFDRWGNQIFKSNDIYKGWDGRVQGKSDVVQIDTYVYVVTCREMFSGKKRKFIGHVNVVK